MQRQSRPELPAKIRIITAWVIWGALLLALAGYYYLGWVMPREPRQENSAASVTVMVLMATAAGSISLALNVLRRARVQALGKKFVMMIVGAAFAETVALFGFTIRFVFNAAPDRATFLLTASAVLHLLNMPTDFKSAAPPEPGSRDDLGLPPPIG